MMGLGLEAFESRHLFENARYELEVVRFRDIALPAALLPRRLRFRLSSVYLVLTLWSR